MMQRRPDPPFLEVSQHHVAPSPSVHSPYPADDLAAKVNALAAMLKVQWCPEHQDFHEIAGGSERQREIGGPAVGDTTLTGGMDGI
jgi:hypothetical protein